jgi:hypothetical protein
MANLKLGQRPKAFAPISVKFTGPDGDELVIPSVVYKYRTRAEYGSFVDSNSLDAATYTPAEGEKFSVKKLLDTVGAQNVQALLESIESWGLDEPVNVATLTQMLDECPAAVNQLWATSGNAARDGRLGN